jgi:hypothetical protein
MKYHLPGAGDNESLQMRLKDMAARALQSSLTAAVRLRIVGPTLTDLADMQRGRTVKAGAAKGGKLRPRPMKAEQRAAAKAERDKLMGQGYTKNAACNLVVEQLRTRGTSVSSKTIGRIE